MYRLMNRSHSHEGIRQACARGALVGLVLTFVALIGVFTAFATIYVVRGVLSLSQVLLALGPLLAGRAQKAGQRLSWREALAGGLSGVVAGTFVGLLALAVASVNMRAVLVNATPQLVRTLTFGLPLGLGVISLVGFGGLLGAAGAAWVHVPSRLRFSVALGLGTVVVLGALRQNGLAPVLAAVVLALVSGGAWLYKRQWQELQTSYELFRRRNESLLAVLRWPLALVFLLAVPYVLGTYGTSVLNLVGLYVLMGLGLNIVVGYAGLLDLGYVAFFTIGAYVTGLLTSPRSSLGVGLSFWAAWPAAMLAAMVAGVLLGIPVLRMRGDYLAIVTLGFGEIIRILVLSDSFKPILGGAQGIIEIPGPRLGGFQFVKPQHFYYLILLGCLLAVIVSRRLADSRVGRAWLAIREDEDVAEATGINIVKYKLLAFALGASFSGIGGAIFASWLHAIFPNSFTLLVSINILSLVIVGGLGSIPGVIMGALVLVGLPEVLRAFAEYRMLAFGALLVIMMLARPEGIWPAKRVREELRRG